MQEGAFVKGLTGKMKKHGLLRDKVSISALFFPLVFLFSSCVATQHDVMILNQQIRTLNAQVHNLEKIREQQADYAAELDSIREELKRLSGDVEENRHLVQHAVERDTLDQDTLKTGLADLREKVARLYQQLNLKSSPDIKGNASENADTRTESYPPTGASPKEQTALSEKKLYEQILAAYREQQYDTAIEGFKKFIRTYPASTLADNAQFWIGESYMALKKYKEAIRAYQEVIRKYPTANKVPNAMLKQALAFLEEKDPVAARIILKKLIKKYPDSDESRIARKKLKAI